MKKATNKFGPTTGTATSAEVMSDILREGVERLTAGAPAPEPATIPKTRKARVVDPRITNLLMQQEEARNLLLKKQQNDREAMRNKLKADALAAKAAARRARILAAMTAEEREQLRQALEKQ